LTGAGHEFHVVQRDARAYVALAGLALVWGYTWVVLKVATVDATPVALTAIRTALGAAALFVLLAVTRRPLRSPPIVPTMILGILNTAGFFVFQTLAVAAGGAGKAAILAYTYPFWIALLSWPLLGARVPLRSIVGLALAAGGLAFILIPVDLAHGLLSKGFALLTAVDWAFAAVYAKRMRARHDVELLSLTAWQTLYGAIPLVIIALLVPHQSVRLTPAFGWAIAYIALGGTALGQLLWLFALGRLHAAAAGLASLLTPVITLFAAWFELGEHPSAAESLGIALILCALVADVVPNLVSGRAVHRKGGTADVAGDL
jgi:drug/metabolite transporter (DMT)-like permease